MQTLIKIVKITAFPNIVFNRIALRIVVFVINNLSIVLSVDFVN